MFAACGSGDEYGNLELGTFNAQDFAGEWPFTFESTDIWCSENGAGDRRLTASPGLDVGGPYLLHGVPEGTIYDPDLSPVLKEGADTGDIVAAGLQLCDGVQPDGSIEITGSPSDDTMAKSACTHYANVLGDVRLGILTDAELLEKIREVYDSAKLADDPAVAANALQLLQDTVAASPRLAASVEELAAACEPHLEAAR